MYAPVGMLARRSQVTYRARCWLLLLSFLVTLGIAAVPYLPTALHATPTSASPTHSAFKGVGPLSSRLAMLAQASDAPMNRAEAMRLLSLPESGPGSLLTDPAGAPLVYIHLQHAEQRFLAALRAAGAH